MNVNQPHRVSLELANGGGVMLEPVCALCHEDGDGVLCPICDRLFCTAPCFTVHLNARDALDSPTAVDALLESQHGPQLIEMIEKLGDVKVDWPHARHCVDCKQAIHAGLAEVILVHATQAESACK